MAKQSVSREELKQCQVFGATTLSYGQAWLNLKIIAGNEAAGLLKDMQPMGWYSGEIFKELEKIVVSKYKDYGPIMEKVGIEMMKMWYHHGPGKDLIKKGTDFLSFQAGSNGYRSVIKGPANILGDFKLEVLDEKSGKARMVSTTPFSRDM